MERNKIIERNEFLKELEQNLKNELFKSINNIERVKQIQRTRAILARHGLKERGFNPYNEFMRQCILSQHKEGMGRPEMQGIFKKCAEKWEKLTEAEKKQFKIADTIVADYS